MTYIKIEWAPPDDGDPWTQISIERSTTGVAGTFTELAEVAASNGSYIDQNGVAKGDYWYKTRFLDPSTGVYDAYTNAIQGGDATGYITLEQARKLTKLQISEFDDETMAEFIYQASQQLDQDTGRTWQGTQTVSNELYDGTGTTFLQLKQTDIVSLTAISVDESNNGTFTTVTPGSVDTYKEGVLKLDNSKNSDLEVTSFGTGNKTVKVSYTYGNSTPTFIVKKLTAMMIVGMVKNNQLVYDTIDKMIKKLRFDGITF